MLKEYIKKVNAGANLSFDEAREAMQGLVSGGVSDAEIAALLVGLHKKGEAVEEIAGFASVMREVAEPIAVSVDRPLVDTCGTGGGTLRTFNVSTVIIFILAAGGVAVAKHGNRAITSKCGSADVLEELGANIELLPSEVARCIEEVGVGFLFAPLFHKAMKYVQPVRKSLSHRTIFNLLGPLSNPLKVEKQVIGVYSAELTEKLAKVLKRLGSKRAMVVHGFNSDRSLSMDEVSVCGATKVSELRNGEIKNYELTPEEAGLKPCTTTDFAAQGFSPAKENAQILRNTLLHPRGGTPGVELVLMNAAAGFYVAGVVSSIAEGVELAREQIDSGRAYRKLEEFIQFTNKAKRGRL